MRSLHQEYAGKIQFGMVTCLSGKRASKEVKLGKGVGASDTARRRLFPPAPARLTGKVAPQTAATAPGPQAAGPLC